MDTNKGLLAMIGEHVEESLQESNVEGKTLGKYVIGRELGSGGMGAVYDAKDNMGRTVVVKIVKFQSKDPAYRESMMKRFDREAQAAGQIDHPNVARVMSYDVIEGRQLLVLRELGPQAFDRDDPTEARRSVRPRDVHGGHSTAIERRAEDVTTDRLRLASFRAHHRSCFRSRRCT